MYDLLNVSCYRVLNRLMPVNLKTLVYTIVH